MKIIKLMFVLLFTCLFLLSAPGTQAQERGNDKKENKGNDDKHKYQDKAGNKNKDRDKDYDGRYDRRKDGTLGGVLGRVILPPRGTRGPRRLEGVPKGHYPPPGECRVWYPNRPPGHQPPSTDCRSLVGIRLEPGAFVLHGDRAYDAEYDWREEERRRPGSVGRDILDILFPRR